MCSSPGTRPEVPAQNNIMKILFGVTGGIAAYKTPSIISALTSLGHEVAVVATKAALEFVTEISLATMSKRSVGLTLESEKDGSVKHIELAGWCSVFVVCPASANFVAKMAHGLADDLLSTIHLAIPAETPKLICPAMNTHMFQNVLYGRNAQILECLGYRFLEPEEGLLACGVSGKGKLPGTRRIVEFITKEIS